jgi:hypothetical protein
MTEEVSTGADIDFALAYLVAPGKNERVEFLTCQRVIEPRGIYSDSPALRIAAARQLADQFRLHVMAKLLWRKKIQRGLAPKAIHRLNLNPPPELGRALSRGEIQDAIKLAFNTHYRRPHNGEPIPPDHITYAAAAHTLVGRVYRPPHIHIVALLLDDRGNVVNVRNDYIAGEIFTARWHYRMGWTQVPGAHAVQVVDWLELHDPEVLPVYVAALVNTLAEHKREARPGLETASTHREIAYQYHTHCRRRAPGAAAAREACEIVGLIENAKSGDLPGEVASHRYRLARVEYPQGSGIEHAFVFRVSVYGELENRGISLRKLYSRARPAATPKEVAAWLSLRFGEVQLPTRPELILDLDPFQTHVQAARASASAACGTERALRTVSQHTQKAYRAGAATLEDLRAAQARHKESIAAKSIACATRSRAEAVRLVVHGWPGPYGRLAERIQATPEGLEIARPSKQGPRDDEVFENLARLLLQHNPLSLIRIDGPRRGRHGAARLVIGLIENGIALGRLTGIGYIDQDAIESASLAWSAKAAAKEAFSVPSVPPNPAPEAPPKGKGQPAAILGRRVVPVHAFHLLPYASIKQRDAARTYLEAKPLAILQARLDANEAALRAGNLSAAERASLEAGGEVLRDALNLRRADAGQRALVEGRIGLKWAYKDLEAVAEATIRDAAEVNRLLASARKMVLAEATAKKYSLRSAARETAPVMSKALMRQPEAMEPIERLDVGLSQLGACADVVSEKAKLWGGLPASAADEIARYRKNLRALVSWLPQLRPGTDLAAYRVEQALNFRRFPTQKGQQSIGRKAKKKPGRSHWERMRMQQSDAIRERHGARRHGQQSPTAQQAQQQMGHTREANPTR